jgi:hypothetical protein
VPLSVLAHLDRNISVLLATSVIMLLLVFASLAKHKPVVPALTTPVIASTTFILALLVTPQLVTRSLTASALLLLAPTKLIALFLTQSLLVTPTTTICARPAILVTTTAMVFALLVPLIPTALSLLLAELVLVPFILAPFVMVVFIFRIKLVLPVRLKRTAKQMLLPHHVLEQTLINTLARLVTLAITFPELLV